jgi:hypothetical protein
MWHWKPILGQLQHRVPLHLFKDVSARDGAPHTWVVCAYAANTSRRGHGPGTCRRLDGIFGHRADHCPPGLAGDLLAAFRQGLADPAASRRCADHGEDFREVGVRAHRKKDEEVTDDVILVGGIDHDEASRGRVLLAAHVRDEVAGMRSQVVVPPPADGLLAVECRNGIEELCCRGVG